MRPLSRYSERYTATGGLAAEGVLNQLGRPDIEPLEVLVREAVQNCWDAKRPGEASIRVIIGRRTLDADRLRTLRQIVLPDPPSHLPLAHELRSPVEILYFADFGTAGLGGPTRADVVSRGVPRDFVDFVRNIGQPPDKELGGGSFGYGKAAFYIASRARTVLVDTLCQTDNGVERRFIACALGKHHAISGVPYTGRHWWGRLDGGVPEPATNDEAATFADLLGLPRRTGPGGLGTTVAVVAPGVRPEGVDAAEDPTMRFVADTLIWNFWPRIVSSPGGEPSMRFELYDGDGSIAISDPRTHERLRSFVEAMDRLREEDEGEAPDDPLVIDRRIECLRPMKRLGRLVVQRAPVAPIAADGQPVPQGAEVTRAALHHVALMRNAELVVKYLPGAEPATGRIGYAGVFRCSLDVDEAFRSSEPPTHDDWIHRFVENPHERRFVKVALDRIRDVCREVAGVGVTPTGTEGPEEIPLGEFADALAGLMPTFGGPGARRSAIGAGPPRRSGSSARAPGESAVAAPWVPLAASTGGESGEGPATKAPSPEGPGIDAGNSKPAATGGDGTAAGSRPAIRVTGAPRPVLFEDQPALAFPFELRTNRARVRLRVEVEVMTHDGRQVEHEPPAGYVPPEPMCWVAPDGRHIRASALAAGPEDVDGVWRVLVPIVDDVMVRANIQAEPA